MSLWLIDCDSDLLIKAEGMKRILDYDIDETWERFYTPEMCSNSFVFFMNVLSVFSVIWVSAAVWQCLLWCGCTYKLFSTFTRTQERTIGHFSCPHHSFLWDMINNLPTVVTKRGRGVSWRQNTKSALPAACCMHCARCIYLKMKII